MLLFSEYKTDTGRVSFLFPVSFSCDTDNVTVQSLFNDIPIEIQDKLIEVANTKGCGTNIKSRQLTVTTPQNITYTINCPIPFREVDLDVFVQSGYIVKTKGEVFMYG